ncbi:RapZ C-terminal domain-containing protein [Actinotignum sp. GS-2025c]|uniref:RapZ C-terminal domain-containing protein n=1 Tax=Actinotignum sp. GS-2025c TaxID=3427276 RepID=UPI003F46E068
MAIGCTGGKHRSVAIAEAVSEARPRPLLCRACVASRLCGYCPQATCPPGLPTREPAGSGRSASTGRKHRARPG